MLNHAPAVTPESTVVPALAVMTMTAIVMIKRYILHIASRALTVKIVRLIFLIASTNSS
jgi:hypothetical protein